MIKKLLLTFFILTCNQASANKIIQAIEKNDLDLVSKLVEGYNFSSEEKASFENAARKNLETKKKWIDSYFKMTIKDALKIIGGTLITQDLLKSSILFYIQAAVVMPVVNAGQNVVIQASDTTGIDFKDYIKTAGTTAVGFTFILSMASAYLTFAGLRKHDTKYQYVKSLGIMGLIKNLK